VIKNKNTKRLLLFGATIAAGLALPAIGYCSVESSLGNVQSKIEILLPILATIGLGFAGVSFLMGSPNARNHLILAIIGAAIGFGASSIMGFIRSVVN
jgi:hypothetical protein